MRKRLSDANSRTMINSKPYIDSWQPIAVHMKRLVPQIAEKHKKRKETTPASQKKSSEKKQFTPGAAKNVRIYRISHLGGKNKLIFEGVVFNKSIERRAQTYANRTGYLVRCLRQEPHLIKSFKPRVWREASNSPPIVDPDAPEPIRGLGYSAHRADAGMFFDDRKMALLSKTNVIAWLNPSKYGGFWLKIMQADIFKLRKPIPKEITDFGDAVDWVLNHGEWR